MKEVSGDIWGYHAQNKWIVITTNGVVNAQGKAVMGRGVAREAAMKFSDLPRRLAERLNTHGNHVFVFGPYRLITLPVKHQWFERADMQLVARSVQELIVVARALDARPVYMVRPGCGNGQLNWVDVHPTLVNILDNNFVVVERSSDDSLDEQERMS
jgi:hypothetical protein